MKLSIPSITLTRVKTKSLALITQENELDTGIQTEQGILTPQTVTKIIDNYTADKIKSKLQEQELYLQRKNNKYQKTISAFPIYNKIQDMHYNKNIDSLIEDTQSQVNRQIRKQSRRAERALVKTMSPMKNMFRKKAFVFASNSSNKNNNNNNNNNNNVQNQNQKQKQTFKLNLNNQSNIPQVQEDDDDPSSQSETSRYESEQRQEYKKLLFFDKHFKDPKILQQRDNWDKIIDMAKRIAKSKPTMDIYNRYNNSSKKKNYTSKVCNMFLFEPLTRGKTKLDLQQERDYLIFQMILRKHKYKRSKFELKLLENTVENLQFFQQFKRMGDMDAYYDIFKFINFDKIKQYEAVFRQGDVPERAYIILKGEVLVLAQSEYPEDPNEVKKKLKKFKVSNSDCKLIQDMYPNQRIINIIQAGKTFGDIGLYYKTKRTATIIAKSQEVHLLSLSSADFNLTLREAFNSQSHKQKISFLNNIPLFKTMPVQYQNIILMLSEEISFQWGYQFYKIGDIQDYLYIITQGEVEISQKIHYDDTKIEFEEYLESQKSHYDKSTQQHIDAYFKKFNAGSIEELTSFNRKLRIYKQNGERIPVSIIGVYSVFGDEDLYASGKRQQSARGVSSIGKALKIPRIAFYDQVKGQGQIIQMIQDKNQIVQDNIDNIKEGSKDMIDYRDRPYQNSIQKYMYMQKQDSPIMPKSAKIASPHQHLLQQQQKIQEQQDKDKEKSFLSLQNLDEIKSQNNTSLSPHKQQESKKHIQSQHSAQPDKALQKIQNYRHNFGLINQDKYQQNNVIRGTTDALLSQYNIQHNNSFKKLQQQQQQQQNESLLSPFLQNTPKQSSMYSTYYSNSYQQQNSQQKQPFKEQQYDQELEKAKFENIMLQSQKIQEIGSYQYPKFQINLQQQQSLTQSQNFNPYQNKRLSYIHDRQDRANTSYISNNSSNNSYCYSGSTQIQSAKQQQKNNNSINFNMQQQCQQFFYDTVIQKSKKQTRKAQSQDYGTKKYHNLNLNTQEDFINNNYDPDDPLSPKLHKFQGNKFIYDASYSPKKLPATHAQFFRKIDDKVKQTKKNKNKIQQQINFLSFNKQNLHNPKEEKQKIEYQKQNILSFMYPSNFKSSEYIHGYKTPPKLNKRMKKIKYLRIHENLDNEQNNNDQQKQQQDSNNMEFQNNNKDVNTNKNKQKKKQQITDNLHDQELKIIAFKNLKIDKTFPDSQKTQDIKQFFAKINQNYTEKKQNQKIKSERGKILEKLNENINRLQDKRKKEELINKAAIGFYNFVKKDHKFAYQQPPKTQRHQKLLCQTIQIQQPDESPKQQKQLDPQQSHIQNHNKQYQYLNQQKTMDCKPQSFLKNQSIQLQQQNNKQSQFQNIMALKEDHLKRRSFQLVNSSQKIPLVLENNISNFKSNVQNQIQE